jgi:hypothetical protein
MMDGYTVIRHPITGRFVCKVDFRRDIMYVVDRGNEALIDLAQVRSADDDPGKTLQERQGLSAGCGTNDSSRLAGSERYE